MTTPHDELPTLLRSLKTSLDSQTDAVNEFKRQYAERLDRLETRVSRPGTQAAAGEQKDDAASLVEPSTGRPLVVIKAGDNIAQKFLEARSGAGMPAEPFSPGELKLGDFVRAVAGQTTSDMARKALAIGTDSAGGHLVPQVLMPGLLDALVAQSSLLQAGATIATPAITESGGKTYTWAAVDTVPTAAWRSEAGNVAESDPTFRTVVATPRSLAFFFKVSRELLMDAVNLEEALPTIIGQAFARELDRVGLIGSGTAPEPRGILNTVGIQSVTNGAAGASLATTRYANLMSAVQAILSANGPVPTAAIMAPRTLVGFNSLADTTNQPLQPPALVRDMRMYATSQLPVNKVVGGSSDCSDIFVGNFDRVRFFMREQMSILRADQLFAGTGQVGFYCHVRADVICTYPTTLAVISGVRP
jgi:HK97 family phage major capsid protein